MMCYKFKKVQKMEFAAFKFKIVTPLLRGGVTIISFSKKYKKSGFCGFIKTFFDFVPRGTNVNNFFVRKILLFY